MRRQLACLIPSRTPEYLEALLKSTIPAKWVPGDPPPVLVRSCIYVADNGLTPEFRAAWPGVFYVPVQKPFVFAKAINLAAAKALEHEESDFIILNDDTEILTPYYQLQVVKLLDHPAAQPFGLISLMIEGGVGNPEQQFQKFPKLGLFEAKKTICFVCTIIRYETWMKVGPLDERFTGYGYDDDDYCRRVREAGFKTGVTNVAVVQHGKAGLPHSSSYLRYHGQAGWQALYEINKRIFDAKWSESGIPKRRCLNLGCGDKPLKSNPDGDTWVNLDLQAKEGVDVVRDIRRGLPFDNAVFDHVFADNILEHLPSDDLIFAINEIDRILRVGGTATIIVPHAHSQGALQDPTHKSLFVPRSCIYWNQEMSKCGGLFVGVTANLIPQKVDCFGDQATEYFIKFELLKKAWPTPGPEKVTFIPLEEPAA